MAEWGAGRGGGAMLDGIRSGCHIPLRLRGATPVPRTKRIGEPMTTLVTRVMTWLQGERVGADSFGNCYYQERAKPAGRRRRRWVVYKQEDEASRVPPSWHAWLHYTVILDAFL